MKEFVRENYNGQQRGPQPDSLLSLLFLSFSRPCALAFLPFMLDFIATPTACKVHADRKRRSHAMCNPCPVCWPCAFVMKRCARPALEDAKQRRHRIIKLTWLSIFFMLHNLFCSLLCVFGDGSYTFYFTYVDETDLLWYILQQQHGRKQVTEEIISTVCIYSERSQRTVPWPGSSCEQKNAPWLREKIANKKPGGLLARSGSGTFYLPSESGR